MSKFHCHHIMMTTKHFGCQHSMTVSLLLSMWSSNFDAYFVCWQSHSVWLSAFHFQFCPWLSTFTCRRIVCSHPNCLRPNLLFGHQHSITLSVTIEFLRPNLCGCQHSITLSVTIECLHATEFIWSSAFDNSIGHK